MWLLGQTLGTEAEGPRSTVVMVAKGPRSAVVMMAKGLCSAVVMVAKGPCSAVDWVAGSALLQFLPHTHTERQQMMAHVPGSLTSVWKTWTEFLPLKPLRSELVNRRPIL